MFLGHLLIDRSLVGKWIENRLSELDDNVRLLLPYGFYKYYSRLDDNLFGKVWGALLGAAAFGWGGFITLFILGHILFDVRGNALVKDAKKALNISGTAIGEKSSASFSAFRCTAGLCCLPASLSAFSPISTGWKAPGAAS